jgi:thymidine phosphorylase
MIEFDPDVRGGDGFAIARDILESGRALETMNAIIDAQGRRNFDHNHPGLAKFAHEVKAEKPGIVVGIDNLQIARIARIAGAPKVPGAGVDLMFKLGDKVQQDDVLYRVYAEHHSDLIFTIQECQKSNGYVVGDGSELLHAFVEF